MLKNILAKRNSLFLYDCMFSSEWIKTTIVDTWIFSYRDSLFFKVFAAGHSQLQQWLSWENVLEIVPCKIIISGRYENVEYIFRP